MATIELRAKFTIPDIHTFRDVDDNDDDRTTVTFDAEQVKELAGCIVEYVGLHEASLAEDYGPQAWGDYEGAIITGAEVVALVDGRVIASGTGDWLTETWVTA